MKIRKLIRERKFMLGKVENRIISEFLAHFGIKGANVESFSAKAEEGTLIVREVYEPK